MSTCENLTTTPTETAATVAEGGSDAAAPASSPMPSFDENVGAPGCIISRGKSTDTSNETRCWRPRASLDDSTAIFRGLDLGEQADTPAQRRLPPDGGLPNEVIVSIALFLDIGHDLTSYLVATGQCHWSTASE
mmetsp:Transcript_24047/g.51925  ORF Transcript_24047/g.51925 Transcript_24047/m.51925 type:complete len:134 (-) Transcript_24047:1255-1656(-)